MRFVAILTFVAACSAAAVAQQQQPAPQTGKPGAGMPAPRKGLQYEAKLRYIVKQLDLDDKQREAAQDFLVLYRQGCDDQRARGVDILQQIRTLMVEAQDADKAGDKAKAAALRQSAQDLRPGVLPEREFYENLNGILTEPQKTQLKKVQERVAANPDVQLTPADVVQAARDQKLSDEQNKKLTAVQEGLRTKQDAAPAADAAGQAALLDGFIKDVRGVLTPEQGTAFDKQIERMRPDPPAPPAPVAAPSPSAKPEAAPANPPPAPETPAPPPPKNP